MRRSSHALVALALLGSVAAAPAPAPAPAPDPPVGTGILPNFATEGVGLVRLLAGAFDPLSDPAPTVPGVGLVAEEDLPPGVPQPWLVQVRDRRYADAHEAILAAGGTVLGAIPDDTYIVRATPAQRAVIAASPAVRWTGYLQPAWRIPAAAAGRPALTELEGVQTYRVYGFADDPRTERLAADLEALAGVEVVEQVGTVAVVRATASELGAIAALPQVEGVGVVPTVVLHNANARWVIDTGVRDLFHLTRPTVLTGAGQTAAVADTGANYVPDRNGNAHEAFHDCAPHCKVADYTQAASGNTTSAMTTIRDNRAADGLAPHRKVVAYFDLGGAGAEPPDESAHGSHVAGTVAGDAGAPGTPEGHDGLAPGARLVLQQIATPTGSLGGLPADLYQLFRQAYRPRDPASVPTTYTPSDYANYRPLEDARTHNNSWGLIVPIVDTGDPQRLDKFVWDHEDMVVVVSAGNSGPDPASVGSPATAKNDLTSAASDNGRQPGSSIDTLAHFSSHGPTGDGRLGVDLATPGQIIISAKGGTASGYHYLQGTSMSAPVLTGVATLVRQYFYDGYGPAGGDGFPGGTPDAARRHNPSAALVKATLVAGATRMRGWYTGTDGGDRNQDGLYPSEGQGFGLVNLERSLYLAGDPTNNWYQDVWRADPDAFGPGVGSQRSYQVQVGDRAPLEVALAWTDPPAGLPAGTPVLVNDLDLIVTAPDGTTYVGNNFPSRTDPTAEAASRAGSGPTDTVNNVEKVRIPDPAPGVYTITVRGTKVMMGPQGFALAAAGDLAPVGESFDAGPPLQQDLPGSPTISDLRVERISADATMVRFHTNEPTTARIHGVVAGAQRTFADVYTQAPGSFFTDYFQPGPIETSAEYAGREVMSTDHEVLVFGSGPGQRLDLTVEATDLAGNSTTTPLTVTTPTSVFQPLAPDTANLFSAATDVLPSQLVGGSGWGTSTQLYAGFIGGTQPLDAIGVFMVRLPESIDPERITGAAIELVGSYEFASHYGPEDLIAVDLLDPSVEDAWGTQNFAELAAAPAAARANPTESVLAGGGVVHTYTLTCTGLEALKATLRETGERRAAFRIDTLRSADPFIVGFEIGFNRRSRGPQVRPRLVLQFEGEAPHLPVPCDPATPAPTITDVEIAPGEPSTDTAETVVVSWRTDVPSDSVVLYRVQDTDPSSPGNQPGPWTQVGSPTLTRLHQLGVSGLDPAVRYEFVVRSRACNGATTTDTNGGQGYAFFLDPGVPPTPPDTFDVHASFGFTSDLEGWVATEEGGGATPLPGDENHWAWDGSSGNPPGSAAVSPYFDQSTAILTAPAPVQFSAGGVPQLAFDLDIDSEPTFDFLYVEYQVAGGSWTQAAAFDGFSGGFTPQVVDLDAPPGTDVLVRFRFAADELISTYGGYTGVWIDNVELRTGFGGDPGIPPDPSHVVPPHPAPPAEGSGLTAPPTRAEPTEADMLAGTGLGCPVSHLSVGDVEVDEGDSGTTTAMVPLTLDRPAAVDVTVTVVTQDGTASADEGDYTPLTDPVTVTIPAGETQGTAEVEVVGDEVPEPDETFAVVATSIAGAVLVDPTGTVTIRNDDGEPPALSVADTARLEGDGPGTIPVGISLSAPAVRDVRVRVRTSDLTARAGEDYTAVDEVVTIPAGQTAATIDIEVLGDTTPEPDESFAIHLSDATNAAIADADAVVTLLNDDAATITRVAGSDRIATAVQVSMAVFPDGADVVVLARHDVYADALAGAPYAAVLEAPILLTPSDRLDGRVAAEIRRLGATRAVLLGGEQALAPVVADQLRAQTGVQQVDRVAGPTRFDTAAEIRREIALSCTACVTEAYVVEGANPDPTRGWPDAVAVSALAAHQRRPILLVTRDVLPEATRRALVGTQQATIVGGPAAVSSAVASEIDGIVPDVERLFGLDRYGTSRVVADRSLVAGLSAERVWLASGGNWPDALVAGPAVARDGGVLLLVHPEDLDKGAASRDWLRIHRREIVEVRLLGGVAAISSRVQAQLADVLAP